MKDYFGYEGKVCVVTGAASGMGKSAAEMLVDLGAKVYALDWAEVKIEGIEKYIHVDLSQKESIDKAFELLPETIDSFFGIAGISGSKHDFLTTVAVDFISNKYMSEKYLIHRMSTDSAIMYITSTGGIDWNVEENKALMKPVIEAKEWDEIINILKGMSLDKVPGTLGYPFAKLAMNYYVAYVQDMFTSKKIRVNALLPGSTVTGMVDEFEKMAGGEEALLSHCGNAGRLASSDEMGMPSVFLNSKMASYISGELLVVDYGSTLPEQSGIKEYKPMNFKQILDYMAQMAQKK